MKIKSYILKPIAWIIILSFIFQDIVWANPDIGNPSANTLQVPSRLQPFIDQESFNKTLLEFPIKTILQSTDINTFRYRLTPRLTGNLEGLQLDLDFSPPDEKANKKTGKVRREDGWIIPCAVLDRARGRRWQYEVFVRDDKSIELQTPEVQKPESAKKTDTGPIRFSLNDSKERINAAAAKLGYPGMEKGAIAEVNKALAKRKIFEPEATWPFAAGVVFLLLSSLTAIKFLSVSLMVLGPLGIIAAVTVTLIMRVIDRAHRKAKIGAAIDRLLAGVDEAEVELGKGNIPPELSENIPLAIITKYEDDGAGNNEPLMGTSELVSLKNLIEKARAELKAFESGDSLGLNERQVYELLRRGRAGAPSVFDNIIRRVIFRTPYNGRESEVYKLFRALEVAETIARESDILASRYEDIGDERIKEIIEETKAKHRFSMEEMIKLNELLIKRGSSSYKYPLFSLWVFNIAVFFAPVFIFYIFAPYAITYVGIHGADGGFIGMISGVFINWYASHPYASAIFLTASLIISIINWIFKDFYISPAGLFFNSEKVKLKDGMVTARRGVVNTPTAEMRDFILKSEGVRAVSGFLQTKRAEIERLCELTGNDIGSVDEAKLVDMILSENNIYRLGKGSNAPPRILVDELFNASEVDINFPIYTIALPAFGEPDVIKELIDSISNLIYPKDKLDIILLPEASDSFPRKGEKISTLERLHEKLISDPEKYSNITVLTSPIRVLDEHNQAKPYSTNYLLGITQGKYLVIYDAEDRPYPLQMVEALVGFENRPYYLERLIRYIYKDTGSGKFDIRKIRAHDPDLYRKIIEYRFDAPVIADYVKDYRKLNPQILERQLILDVSKAYIEYSKLGVLQAPLTWYNPVTLTSTQFILDYGTWFGIFLPGLEARELPVSHGGTSNHFLVKVLMEAGGWDPHNVTEDAAIAIAIQRLGYSSLMLSSITAEEAPTRQVTPKKWVWIGQHSRWGKGYVQTFLILLRNLFRHPIQMYRAFGVRGVISNIFLFGVGTYSYIFTSLFVSTTFLWGISNLIVMGPVWAIAVMSFVVLLVSVMRGFSLIKTSVLSAGVVAANLIFWSVITSFAHYYLMMVPAALPVIPWLAGIVHAPAFLVGMVIMFAPMMTHIFYNLAAAWVGTPHRNFVITTTINEMRLRARAIKENDKDEAAVLEALADNLEKDPKFYRHLLYRAALLMTFTYRPFSILSFWLGYGQFLRGRPFWWDKTEHAGRGGAEDSGGVLGRVNGVLKAVRHRYITSSINNKPVFLRFEWGALAFVILVAVFSFTSSIRYVRNKFMPDPGSKIRSSLYSSEQMDFMSRFGEGYSDYEGNVARGRAYYDKIISTYKDSPEYLKGRIKDMIRSYPKDGLARSMEEEIKICILAYMDITVDSIEDERQRERALEAFLEDLRISISQYGDRPIQKNSLERALDLAAGRSSDVPKNVPGWLWQCLEDTYDARTRMTFWGIYLLDRKPKWPLKFPEIPELPKSKVIKSGAGMIVVGSGLANINAVGSEWLNLAGLGLVFLGVIILSRKYIWKALVWIFTPSDIFVPPIKTTGHYNDDARKLHELLQKTAEINRRIGLDKKPENAVTPAAPPTPSTTVSPPAQNPESSRVRDTGTSEKVLTKVPGTGATGVGLMSLGVIAASWKYIRKAVVRIFTSSDVRTSMAEEKNDRIFEETLKEKIAISRYYVEEIKEPVRAGFVISIYKKERLMRSSEHRLGLDYLRIKIAQLEELFGGTKVDWEIILVDDGTPGGDLTACGIYAEEIMKEYPENIRKKVKVISLQRAVNENLMKPEQQRNPVISGIKSAKKDSKKGGSIDYGMYEAARAGCDYIFYTDTDLSFHLGQAGILLRSMMEGKRERVGLSIGSREHGESSIVGSKFRWVRSMVYHIIVRVFLPQMFSIKDSQAAFKCFTREVVVGILPYTTERGAAFDTELIMLTQLAGYDIREIGIAWRDTSEGSNFTWRDALNMLKQLWEQRKRYNGGIYDDVRRRPRPNVDKSYEHGLESTLVKATFQGLDPAEAIGMVRAIWQVRGEYEIMKGYRQASPVKVTSPSGKVYYLKPIATSLQGAKFVAELSIFLKKNEFETGIKVPSLVPDIFGAYFVKRGKFYWALEEGIELPEGSSQISRDDAGERHFEALGSAAARLHNVLRKNGFISKLEEVMKYEFLASDLMTEQWEDLKAEYVKVIGETNGFKPQDQTRGQKLMLENWDFIQKRIENIEARFSGAFYKTFPWEVCHSDLSLGNVWFGRDGQVVGIADFSKSRWSPRLEEFKNPVMTHPEYGRIYDPASIIGFLRGYQQTASLKLDEKEIEALLDVIEATFLLAYLGMLAYKREKLDDVNSDRYDAFLYALENHKAFLREREVLKKRLLTLAGSNMKRNEGVPPAFENIVSKFWMPQLAGENQVEAARSLGIMGSKGAVDELIVVLENNMHHPALRKKAAEALGWIGASEAVIPMKKVLEDASQPEEVRSACSYGLAKLGVAAFVGNDRSFEDQIKEFSAEEAVRGILPGLSEKKPAERTVEALETFRRIHVASARRDIADRSLDQEARLEKVRFLKQNEDVLENLNRYDGRVDLHLHTYRSDGVSTPAEVVFRAWQEGMKAIGIVDHNTFAGLYEAVTAGNILGIDVIPGVEIDLYDDELGIQNFHLIAYLPYKDPDDFAKRLSLINALPLAKDLMQYVEARAAKAEETRVRFNELNEKEGLLLTKEEVANISPDQTHRYFLGRALFIKYGSERLGAADSRGVTEKYFPRDLVKNENEKDGMNAEEMINSLKEAGLTLVLAHPKDRGMFKDIGMVRALVGKYRGKIDGIEAYYAMHTAQDMEDLERVADEYGLIKTLGTDDHGDRNDIIFALGSIKESMEGNLPAGQALHENIIERLRARMAILAKPAEKPALPTPVYHNVNYPIKLCREDVIVGNADMTDPEVIKNRLERNIYYANAPPERKAQIVKRLIEFAPAVPFLSEYMRTRHPELEVINISIYGSYPFGDEISSPSDADIMVMVKGNYFSSGEILDIRNDPAFAGLSRSFSQMSIYIMGAENLQEGKIDGRNGSTEEEAEKWRRRQKSVCENTASVLYRRNFVLDGHDFAPNDNLYRSGLSARAYDLLFNSYRRIFLYHLATNETEYERFRIATTRIYDAAVFLKELSHDTTLNVENIFALRRRFERMYPVNPTAAKEEVIAIWTAVRDEHERILSADAEEAFRRQQDSIFRNGGDGPESADTFGTGRGLPESAPSEMEELIRRLSGPDRQTETADLASRTTIYDFMTHEGLGVRRPEDVVTYNYVNGNIREGNRVVIHEGCLAVVELKDNESIFTPGLNGCAALIAHGKNSLGKDVYALAHILPVVISEEGRAIAAILKKHFTGPVEIYVNGPRTDEGQLMQLLNIVGSELSLAGAKPVFDPDRNIWRVNGKTDDLMVSPAGFNSPGTDREVQWLLPIDLTVPKLNQLLDSIPPASQARIKGIIFDIGSVVVRQNDAIAASKISELFNVPADTALEFLSARATDRDNPLYIYEHEKADDQAVANENVRKKLELWIKAIAGNGSLVLTMGDFETIYNSLFTGDNPEIIRLIIALKEKGYYVRALSNTNDIHYRYLMQNSQLRLAMKPEHIYASHLTGFAKPDSRSYFQVVNDLGLEPGQCLMIDDNFANAAGAIDIGLNAVRLNPNDIMSAIKSTVETLRSSKDSPSVAETVIPARLKVGKLDLPVRSREKPAPDAFKIAGVQIPENDFLENTGIMKDAIVGMSGWGVYKPDIVLFPESMDHIDSLRFDPADRLNAIQSVVDVTGIAAGYFIENDRPENKSLDINMTYTVLRPGVSPLIFRKFKEDEENRIFYVNGKKMALLICIESEGAISEPAYRMPELSFKEADAIIVVAGTDKQEAIVWPRDLSRKYRKPVVFVNFGGDKGLLRPQSSFFFAVEGSINSSVELSEDSVLYADIRQNEPGLAEDIRVSVIDDKARARAYEPNEEDNPAGSAAPEEIKSPATAGNAAIGGIEQIKNIVRGFKLRTGLQNASLVVYILRSIGEKARLDGMFRMAADQPFHYIAFTDKWGEIDIKPSNEEVDDYERTAEADERYYEEGLASLRQLGVITEIDRMLSDGVFSDRGTSAAPEIKPSRPGISRFGPNKILRGLRNRSGFGYATGTYFEDEDRYFRELRRYFDDRGFTAEQSDAIVNALVRIREGSLKLRPEFFSAEDTNKILAYMPFDLEGFIARIKTEHANYLGRVTPNGKRLFSDKDIFTLLFRKLIPLSWTEELMGCGLSKSTAVRIVVSWTNPKKMWYEVFEPVRGELIDSGLTKRSATRMVTRWSDPKKTWEKILMPIRDELVSLGLSKSEATEFVITWSDPKKTWEEVLKPVRDEFVDSGLTKRDATRIVVSWSDPKKTWEEVLKPVMDELVKSGLPKSEAIHIVIAWSDPKKTWEEVLRPVRDELVVAGLSRTEALRVVTRWSDPKKTWEDVLRPVRDELVDSGLSRHNATGIIMKWSDPKKTWEDVLKPVRDELVGSGLSISEATYLVVGWSADIKKTWTDVMKPVRDELVTSGLSKSYATRIVTRWKDPKKTWNETLKPVRDELVGCGLSDTEATCIVITRSEPRKTWEETLRPVRDELMNSGLSKRDATNIVITWSDPKERLQAANDTVPLLMPILGKTKFRTRTYIITNSYRTIETALRGQYGLPDVDILRILAPLKGYYDRHGYDEKYTDIGIKPEGVALLASAQPEVTSEATTEPAVSDNIDGVMVADRTHFRNIKDPKQMANNMIEAAMSILLTHKKLVLAFHKDLFKSGRVQVLLRRLAKLKEDPQFGKLLQGLEIIQSCEDLPGELARRDIDASDERNVIFMFAGGDAIAEMQRVSPLVKTVLIDDGKDFEPALYYYPLFEIVAITLLKYHQRYSKEDVGAVFTKFGMTQEEFNIKDFSDDDPRASLVFTLLPRAERLNTAIGPERYGLVLSFIASAA